MSAPKLIHTFPPGERPIAMVEVAGDALILTERGLYVVEGQRVEIGGPVLTTPGVWPKPPPGVTITREPAPKPKATPKPRAPRVQAALDSAYEEITRAAATPPDTSLDEARVRGQAVRRAERHGWRRVIGELRRIPSTAKRTMVHGVEMWKPR